MNTPLKTRRREDLAVDQGPSLSRLQGTAVGVLRLVVGWTFLWAFFDKLLALGYATGRNPETDVVDYFGPDAWINGGSPTYGFLTFSADGPFKDFYTSIAGDSWTNWAFMLGLLAIGVAYMTGICTRLASIGGVVMYVMMWTVALPPPNNPITDDHILGAAACFVLGALVAGRYLGVGRWWEHLPVVQRYPILK
jgi:thiosulfate dehydrogenase [quinone] large subunit